MQDLFDPRYTQINVEVRQDPYAQFFERLGIYQGITSSCIALLLDEFPELIRTVDTPEFRLGLEEKIDPRLTGYRVNNRLFQQNGTSSLLTFSGNHEQVSLRAKVFLGLINEWEWALIKQVCALLSPQSKEESKTFTSQLILLAHADNLPLGLNPHHVAAFLNIHWRARGGLTAADLSAQSNSKQMERLIREREKGTRGLNKRERAVSAVIGKTVHKFLRYWHEVRLKDEQRKEPVRMLLSRYRAARIELENFLAMYDGAWQDKEFIASLIRPENKSIYYAYNLTLSIITAAFIDRMGLRHAVNGYRKLSLPSNAYKLLEERLGISFDVLIKSLPEEQVKGLRDNIDRDNLKNKKLVNKISGFIELTSGDLIIRLLACFISLQGLVEDWPLEGFSGRFFLKFLLQVNLGGWREAEGPIYLLWRHKKMIWLQY